MSETKRIQIDFAIPVDVPSGVVQEICEIVQRVAEANQPPGMIHWQSGCGDLPKWSLVDAAMLGVEPDHDAPATGEPSFDDLVIQITTSCREE